MHSPKCRTRYSEAHTMPPSRPGGFPVPTAVLGIYLSLCLAPVPSVKTQDTSWVGETIVARPEALLKQIGPSGEPRNLPLRHVTYRVIREEADRVWVRQHNVEGYFLKAQALRVKEAEKVLTELLKDSPGDNGIINKRAVVRNHMGDAAGAIEDYLELIKANPGTAVYHNNHATVHLGQNDYDKAVAELEKAFQLQPGYSIALKNRSHAYMGLRRFDDALKDIQACLAADMTYLPAFVFRGMILCEQGKYDDALADADRVSRDLPNDPDAQALRGQVHFAKKEYDKALDELSAALRTEPGNASVRFLRAKTWQAMGNPGKAKFDLDEAVYAHPKRPECRERRGWFLFQTGDYEKAKADFEEAWKLRPGHLPTAASFGFMLATCPDAKYRDGKKALELAAASSERTGNRHGPILDALAAAHAELGAFEKAVEMLKKALADEAYAREEGKELKDRLSAYEAKKPWRSVAK